MARIRTIKPEFFTSEDICSISPLSRLFYVSLWCEADKEGRLDWKPRTFKLRYFPGDDCDINAMAKELIDAGLIVTYEVDGVMYAEIPTFKTHQIINNRESDSSRPSRHFDASPTRESGKEGKEGRERKGREGKGISAHALLSSLGVSDAVAADWIVLRNKKKAPVTQIAMEGIQREADKAGMSLDDALRMCCRRGWAGFEAEWAAKNQHRPSNVNDARMNTLNQIFPGAGNGADRPIIDITPGSTIESDRASVPKDSIGFREPVTCEMAGDGHD